MADDSALFGAKKETKSTSLTLKLSPRQKEWITGAAKKKGLNVSQFMLSIVNIEHERQKKEASKANLKNFFDEDDYDEETRARSLY